MGPGQNLWWGRFCHQKVGPYTNRGGCKDKTSKQAGSWEVASWGGSIAICHVKQIAGEQSWQKNSTESKKKKVKNRVQLKIPRDGKKQAEPIFLFYSVGTWKGEWAFISTYWKLISWQQKRLATQKINVRLSLDFRNSLHTFLLSYFSIPLEITGIKGHFKVGPSWKCFKAVLISHDDRGKTSICSWDCSCFSF